MSVTLITTQSTFSLGNGVLLTSKVSMSVWVKKKKIQTNHLSLVFCLITTQKAGLGPLPYCFLCAFKTQLIKLYLM